MSGELNGRVAIITGAGSGIGREHALLFAMEGASVVVNDVGGAAEVVAEIEARGGRAVASTGSVGDWEDSRRMVDVALDAFGDLHVLVNNAGIIRDRTLVNMTEAEWDSVLDVHLKGHFLALRHAAEHWRRKAKEGLPVRGSVVNTSSGSGLLGNPGQGNYGAAKAGIAALTLIAAAELARYDVRVNAISPAARTAMTKGSPGLEHIARDPDAGAFDMWHPGNVSPFVGWLAAETCRVTGRVFGVYGGVVQEFQPWTPSDLLSQDARWTISELSVAMELYL